MIEDPAITLDSARATDGGLEALLAKGDAELGTVAPILRHLLANNDHSLFSDEIVARVRGMAHDVARQLLEAFLVPSGRCSPPDDGEVDALADGLTGNAQFLCHVHALALEWRLTERLQHTLALDPVLSPLVQALIGSNQAEISALAMTLLAAQARFCQAQQRMQLPLGELPADLLYGALLALRAHAGTEPGAAARAERAEQAIRRVYDEGAGRLGLLSRAVSGMGGGAVAALAIGHAGVALFLTALAAASDQDRDTAVLATSEGQTARLVLALRAAGLKPQVVEQQFLALHPGGTLPRGIERYAPSRAAEMLGLSAGQPRI